MSGRVSERTVFIACRAFENPEFRTAAIGAHNAVTEEMIAFWAAAHTLRVQYEAGEIDNFGADPSIDEVAEVVIKLQEK